MRSAYDLETPRDVHWMELAACRDFIPEAWSLTGNKRSEDNEVAARICQTCPVVERCYEYAVQMEMVDVIMGGVDFTEAGVRQLRQLASVPAPLVDCPQCRKRFPQRRRNQVYCTRRCTDAAATRVA